MLTAQPTPYERMMRGGAYTVEAVDAELRAYQAHVQVHGPNHISAIRARNRIVAMHMRAAAKMASRFHAPGVEIDDWVAYAAMGVARAVELYDFDKGACFLTYARMWMRSRLNNAYEVATTIKIPKSSRDRARHGSATALEAIAAVSGIASLDAESREGGCLLDTVAGEPTDPGAELDRDQMLRAAAHAVSKLDDRSRDIVLRRIEGESLREIGETHGICYERVRQIEAEALREARDLARREMSYPASRYELAVS